MDMQIGTTQLLESWRKGDGNAGEEAMRRVQIELRRIAAAFLARERSGTLQPTSLINEAYLRFARPSRAWNSRVHFFAVATKAMRHVLVDQARKRSTLKRGGAATQTTHSAGSPRPTSSWIEEPWVAREAELLALDDALKRLAELDCRQARIVELRFFGRLTVEQTAVALQIGSATVKRDWAMAMAWLKREMMHE